MQDVAAHADAEESQKKAVKAERIVLVMKSLFGSTECHSQVFCCISVGDSSSS